MTELERRRLEARQRASRGILGLIGQQSESIPARNMARRRMGSSLSQAIGGDIEALKRGVSTFSGHPLNAGKPHMGMEANTSPFSQALLEERRQANMPKETFSPELLASLRGQGVGARHHAGMAVPKPEEEDEYGFLDAMFLANLVAGMQGGPPPTPYGTAVGGGNKTWASLPTLMRMS